MAFGSRNPIAFVATIIVVCLAVVLWFRRSPVPETGAETSAPFRETEPLIKQPAITSPAPLAKPAPRIARTGVTNNEEGELVKKIAVQKELLAELEAETYAKDPQLQVYEKFRNDPQQWFTTNYATGRDPLSAYLRADDPLEAQRREKVCQDLRNLFGMSHNKELAEDPQYTHLFTSAWEFLGRRFPGQLYTGCDRLIGWQEPVTGTGEPLSGQQVLAEIAKRYDRVNQKIAELVQENQIPEDAVAYIRGKSLSQSLTGSCDIYTQTRTPPELKKMREDLRRLEISLHNLRDHKSGN